MSLFPADILRQAETLVALAATKGLKLATAESCTGGLVAAVLTSIPGSSTSLDRGFVTYSNEAKTEMIDVPAGLLAQYGAVSAPVARAMARGAIARSSASVSVSITGVAGPGGGSREKPVGLVHFAAVGPEGLVHVEHRFGDIGREEIRLASVRIALSLLANRLDPS